ncbi:MAG: GNAT family N-acetyltransferase [Desulfobacterium sp.]|nr:GNAT family N-acetyltransferase [Desulfobacterium sp.]MBU3948362.1 GNAT family N-acetyltransferase [Pseudomonadota bacterium]MBU4011665.1 GNAT family N-acetyltransferase [Pseudomonadota bacterium]MBU4036200.1 GNAT family N-acetyltransferase [Pseudomonadota bacterium]
MSSLIIRDANQKDVNVLLKLLKLLFSIEKDFKFDITRQSHGLNMMLDGCGKHRCVKVADINGLVVGMATAQTLISTAEGGISVVVEDMAVSLDWQGRGVGKRLLENITQWAQNRNAVRLSLLTDKDNTAALDFYDHIGWSKTSLICLHKKSHT